MVQALLGGQTIVDLGDEQVLHETLGLLADLVKFLKVIMTNDLVNYVIIN